MAEKWELPSDINLKIVVLVDALGDFITDARDEFDTKSEKWQESEKGQAVETWIEELEEVLEALESAPEKP